MNRHRRESALCVFACLFGLAVGDGCQQQSAPDARDSASESASTDTERQPLTLRIVGVRLMGDTERGLDPRYSIGSESLGEGVTGYHNILAKLTQVPQGGTIILEQVNRIALRGLEGGGHLGTLGVGPDPFRHPPDLFDELNRIAAERHLQLDFVLPESNPESEDDTELRPADTSPYRY